MKPIPVRYAFNDYPGVKDKQSKDTITLRGGPELLGAVVAVLRDGICEEKQRKKQITETPSAHGFGSGQFRDTGLDSCKQRLTLVLFLERVTRHANDRVRHTGLVGTNTGAVVDTAQLIEVVLSDEQEIQPDVEGEHIFDKAVIVGFIIMRRESRGGTSWPQSARSTRCLTK